MQRSRPQPHAGVGDVLLLEKCKLPAADDEGLRYFAAQKQSPVNTWPSASVGGAGSYGDPHMNIPKMTRTFTIATLAACAVAPAFAGTDIGVSIGINQPGVYGRIDIGNYPQPAVVYAQPVVVQPAPVVVERRPIYLYVPQEHQHDWRRWCGRYAACGQPVYFVREDWVRDQYQREHEHDHDRGRHGRGHDDDRRGHDHGPHGHGEGHRGDRDHDRNGH